jgi:hypothetical protein
VRGKLKGRYMARNVFILTCAACLLLGMNGGPKRPLQRQRQRTRPAIAVQCASTASITSLSWQPLTGLAKAKYSYACSPGTTSGCRFFVAMFLDQWDGSLDDWVPISYVDQNVNALCGESYASISDSYPFGRMLPGVYNLIFGIYQGTVDNPGALIAIDNMEIVQQ